MSELKAALTVAGIHVKRYDPSKNRSVYTATGSVTVPKFTEGLVTALGKDLAGHPCVVGCINNPQAMEALLEAYCAEEGLAPEEGGYTIPPELRGLTLNVDRTSSEYGSKRFFCTTPEEFITSHTSGQYYLDLCGIPYTEGVKVARAVVPRYRPRGEPGVVTEVHSTTRQPVTYFNTFMAPEWYLWKIRNPKEWAKLPENPPKEIIDLLKHIIPSRYEREYFYAWLYTSLTARAYVFLVLCGSPGVGKNRLKLLIQALHGRDNTADGKKETFGANENKFNSQMEENTLIWFDELKYGPDMEPRMKEYQNDYISIERKGVDATRSTPIYASMVISNNYPRDNYLLFNSRKFAPLVLAERDLKYAMDSETIGKMSEKLDVSRPNFDVVYIAQIAKWIHKIGNKHLERWPHLEYRGPKFWELAHASMSKWQKTAVSATTLSGQKGRPAGWESDWGAFQWSKVEESLKRRKEFDAKDYRDATTVRSFFDTFCDSKGNKVYETFTAEKDGKKFHDFLIRPIGAGPAVESLAPKLERPKGTSQFQWRRMKEEHNNVAKGDQHDQVADTDYL